MCALDSTTKTFNLNDDKDTIADLDYDGMLHPFVECCDTCLYLVTILYKGTKSYVYITDQNEYYLWEVTDYKYMATSLTSWQAIEAIKWANDNIALDGYIITLRMML